MTDLLPLNAQDEKLIAEHLDGTLSDAGRDELRAALKNNPQLLAHLAELTQLEEHARTLLAEQAASDPEEPGNLVIAISALSAGEEDAELVDLTSRVMLDRTSKRQERPAASKHSTSTSRVIVIPRALAYAAMLTLVSGTLIALFAAMSGKPDPAPQNQPALADRSAARIDRTHNARWDGNTPDDDGGMLPGLYRLERGFAQITFTDGARVTIQGPSSFELVSNSRMELMTGMASAYVPDGSEGFTIASPAGNFVDLGTEFGVDISGAGQAELHVFDGEVEAHARSKTASAPLVVRGGEAIALDEARRVPRTLAYRPEKFAKTWDATQTGVEVSESIRMLYQPPASVQEHQLEHNEQIVMFAEQRGVELQQPLTVSFRKPGRYVRFAKNPKQIKAGRRVDSYFVHFDRVGKPQNFELIPVSGVVTFDRPVIGIIVNDELLDASQHLFRLEGTQYPLDETIRGLEYRPGNNEDPSDVQNFQDLIVLSSDRRTVRMHLETSSRIDQLRILVQAEE